MLMIADTRRRSLCRANVCVRASIAFSHSPDRSASTHPQYRRTCAADNICLRTHAQLRCDHYYSIEREKCCSCLQLACVEMIAVLLATLVCIVLSYVYVGVRRPKNYPPGLCVCACAPCASVMM